MTRFLRSLADAARPAALAAFLAVAACPALAVAGERKPLELTLAFTGDVSGYLEPCG